MTTEKTEALASAEHWERLANENESMAAYERSIGLDLSQPGSSPGDHKARSFRETAKALRLEAATGVRHCSCHFSPRCPSASRVRP